MVVHVEQMLKVDACSTAEVAGLLSEKLACRSVISFHTLQDDSRTKEGLKLAGIGEQGIWLIVTE